MKQTIELNQEDIKQLIAKEFDEEEEHDFHYQGYLPWYKWLWHKGVIRTVRRGCYKSCIMYQIEHKFYES